MVELEMSRAHEIHIYYINRKTDPITCRYGDISGNTSRNTCWK